MRVCLFRFFCLHQRIKGHTHCVFVCWRFRRRPYFVQQFVGGSCRAALSGSVLVSIELDCVRVENERVITVRQVEREHVVVPLREASKIAKSLKLRGLGNDKRVQVAEVDYQAPLAMSGSHATVAGHNNNNNKSR